MGFCVCDGTHWSRYEVPRYTALLHFSLEDAESDDAHTTQFSQYLSFQQKRTLNFKHSAFLFSLKKEI